MYRAAPLRAAGYISGVVRWEEPKSRLGSKATVLGGAAPKVMTGAELSDTGPRGGTTRAAVWRRELHTHGFRLKRQESASRHRESTRPFALCDERDAERHCMPGYERFLHGYSDE